MPLGRQQLGQIWSDCNAEQSGKKDVNYEADTWGTKTVWGSPSSESRAAL